MNPEKDIENILRIVEDVIQHDMDRNYGDRDISIHKLIREWNAFMDNELDETPYEYIRRKSRGPNIK